jgi:hypothetical protein
MRAGCEGGVRRPECGERSLTTAAGANFPLATDCSGTVASGTTERLLLAVKTAKEDK